MRSKNILDGVDFERDVVTTPEASDFLWKVRELNRMTAEEYHQFLEQFTRDLPPDRSTNAPADEPFEL